MKKKLLDWLSLSKPTVFVTVSLKQGIENENGGWSRLTAEHIRKTAWILRDRVTKSVVGKKQRLQFIVFYEGDGTLKRYHLHIATIVPNGMSFREFSDRFHYQAAKLDWIYNEIDIRPIDTNTHQRIIAYSLKEGMDAFIPEASFVPYMN